MKYTFFEKITIAVVLVFLAALLFVTIDSADDCQKQGKVLVRGVFWLECVQK